MSRMLAAKTALAIRVDALGEDTNAELGLEHRAKLERRVRELEEGKVESKVIETIPEFVHSWMCVIHSGISWTRGPLYT